MPLFEFKCCTCKNKEELLVHSIADMPSTVICKQCGNEMLKVFSPTPTIFKCAGFYTTDYARKEKH